MNITEHTNVIEVEDYMEEEEIHITLNKREAVQLFSLVGGIRPESAYEAIHFSIHSFHREFREYLDDSDDVKRTLVNPLYRELRRILKNEET